MQVEVYKATANLPFLARLRDEQSLSSELPEREGRSDSVATTNKLSALEEWR